MEMQMCKHHVTYYCQGFQGIYISSVVEYSLDAAGCYIPVKGILGYIVFGSLLINTQKPGIIFSRMV
jgi:hypothetical protein